MKFFVISDIHSYYDEMIHALNEAGFDPNNENHWLIGCGDYLDRGEKPGAVINYLRSLPRKILVKGNHDDLMVELLERGTAFSHDIHNGTVNTVYRLGYSPDGDWDNFVNVTSHIYLPFYNSMVEYFETQNYIFVHSWIPLIRKDNLPKHYARGRKWAFNDDWRNASSEEWQEARWPNPFEMAKSGFKPNKTVVFGHWHTSWPRANWDGAGEFGPDADFSIYFDDGIIGIDACTAHSKKVNVLVLEDDFMPRDKEHINDTLKGIKSL